jgi:hypothetical protein
VSAYRQNDTGEWWVDLPDSAPCANNAKTLCRIGLHLMRERPTGPGHPLAVIRCRSHGSFFTIYPPGFVPYGRKRLPTDASEVDKGASALDAVHDAADSETARWPDWSDPAGNKPGWASTQWRQIARWGRLLGLTGQPQRTQQIATALGVPLHDHTAAGRQYRRGNYRQRGRAIEVVVGAVVGAGAVLQRLLRAGFIAGLWGRAFAAAGARRLRALVVV